MSAISIARAGPVTTLQDAGRFGMLAHGISASGPMDRGAYDDARALLGVVGSTVIEVTAAGLAFSVEGNVRAAFSGGHFNLKVDEVIREWHQALLLKDGAVVEVTPGLAGNYGYVGFEREIDVPLVMGSQSTNVTVGLGGFHGRGLRAGDRLGLGARGQNPSSVSAVGRATFPLKGGRGARAEAAGALVRVVWGLHADRMPRETRERFAGGRFVISPKLDRMGVRLADPEGVFSGLQQLSLVSDAIVPGDIQILGDGTPIVLMRDHQPTGGYPRIATVVSADFDRFAQMRPGTEVSFRPVSLEHVP